MSSTSFKAGKERRTRPAPAVDTSRVITDRRFAHVHTDPRFQRFSSSASSFTPDARFSRMFTDPAFKADAHVDRWGRRVNSKGADDMRRFYNAHDDAEGEDHEEEKESEPLPKAAPEEEKDDDAAPSTAARATRKAAKVASRKMAAASLPAQASEEGEAGAYTRSYLSSRGVAPPSSSSDDSAPSSPASPSFPNVLGSDSDSDLSPAPLDYPPSDEDSALIPLTDAHTSRLALVNMDWDKLRALDVFALCRSFVVEGGGRVEEVAVYRSDFGKERMREEDRYGPIGLYDADPDDYRRRIEQRALTQSAVQPRPSEDASQPPATQDPPSPSLSSPPPAITPATLNADDGDPPEELPLDQEKLRAYELSRLRYHYAVITCSSPATAHSLYTQLDGSEFESTANKIDLRFIPDAERFEADDVRDRVTHEEVDEGRMAGYRPPLFVTKALQHSRVELSWDGDEEGRRRLRKGVWKGHEDDEDDLAVYLASDGDDDGEGSDALTEAEEDNDDGEGKVKLKRRARARYKTLLSALKKGDGLGGEDGGEDAAGEGDGEKDGEDDGEERLFEMTFEPGLKAKGQALVKAVNERAQRQRETAFEQRARLVKEKRKERKKQRKTAAPGAAGEDKESAEEADDFSVDEDDEFFRGAFDDDDYLPPAQRAKAFFADDPRKERPDKKANRERNSGVHPSAGRSDADVDEEKRKAELELLVMADTAAEEAERDRGYSLPRLLQDNKRKGKKSRAEEKGDEDGQRGGDGFAVDPADARFAAMYERAEFSIDPTHPEYRPTKEMVRVMDERARRRREERAAREREVRQRKARTKEEASAASSARPSSSEAGLEQLVRSVKAKARARDAEAAQREKADAARMRIGTGQRLGEEALAKLNKRQKLHGDLRL